MATGNIWVHIDDVDAWMSDPTNIKRLHALDVEPLPEAWTTSYGFLSADVCPTCQVPLSWAWARGGPLEFWAICKGCVRAWRWMTLD